MDTALTFKKAAAVPALATALTFNPLAVHDADAALVTIDGEQFAALTSGVSVATIGPNFTEDGFTIAAAPGSVDIKALGDLEVTYSGSVALIQAKSGDSYSITKNGGGLFDAISLDLFTFVNGATSTVTIWGNSATQGTVSQDFTFTVSTSATLSNDFQGVSSIWLTQGGIGNVFQADNFVLESDSAVVPLPASGVLMLGALGSIVGARKFTCSKQKRPGLEIN